MLTFILRRFLIMIPTLALISMVAFFIIQLPPGDYLTSYIAQRQATGEAVDQAEIEKLRKPLRTRQAHLCAVLEMGERHGAGRLRPILRLAQAREHADLNRLGLTVAISAMAIVVTWLIAIPIGIYSAVRQYTFFDYLFTLFGFVGMATPAVPAGAVDHRVRQQPVGRQRGRHVQR